jgi:hypothetical protein
MKSSMHSLPPKSRRFGGVISIARLIMGAGPGENVKYRDRNRLDLRRSNLYVVPGRAKGRERAALNHLAEGVKPLSSLREPGRVDHGQPQDAPNPLRTYG